MQIENLELLTFEDVRKYLRISKPTLVKMLKDGEIPGSFKLGSQWRINKHKFLSKLDERAN